MPELLLFFAVIAFLIFMLLRITSKRDKSPWVAPPDEKLPPLRFEARPPRTIFAAPPIQPQTTILRILKGKAWVIDGDTIVIERQNIRISGIDAPEMDHPYGRNAKTAMMGICRGQIVTAQIISDDRHGRLVATCYLDDGRDIAAEMVKVGLALDWQKFSGGKYRPFETADARRKLWRCDARQKGRWIDNKTPPGYASATKRNNS